MELPTETFELTFYNRCYEIDSIQQYRTEDEARQALKLFDEPDSTDLYSRITLTKTAWHILARQKLLYELIFPAQ